MEDTLRSSSSHNTDQCPHYILSEQERQCLLLITRRHQSSTPIHSAEFHMILSEDTCQISDQCCIYVIFQFKPLRSPKSQEIIPEFTI